MPGPPVLNARGYVSMDAGFPPAEEPAVKLLNAIRDVLVRKVLIFEKERGAYPPTFQRELNYQSSRVLFFASVISFSWLSYIPIDRQLHPDEPLILFLRLGLPLLGLIIFIIRFSDYFFERSLLLLNIFGAYLEIATGVITGLTKGDSVYVGGYLFILTLLAVVPLRRRAAWSILAASLVSFFTVGLMKGMTFDSVRGKYSLNDIMATAVVAAIFIYILDRIRFSSWEKSRKIEEQSRELKEDKEKIDRLLLNILPHSVAQELKEKGAVKPIFFESTTILFTDFVGFSKIAENMTPEELVRRLDSIFCYFDSIMDRYKLEKLKTIGDSYMCAGGIPEKNTTHEFDAVLAALDMFAFLKKSDLDESRSGGKLWEMRIGINTGPIMAGVVGEKKFVYDIWGDAVNVASRLETADEPGRINISGQTYNRIRDYFECEHRGNIMVKNRGQIDMYFVNRLRPEYSADADGMIPNNAFLKKYDEIARQ